MWMHHFFSSPHARIRAWCRCPRTRSRPCSRAQKWELGPCLHTISVSSGQSTALFLLLNSCFKMESDKAKWSNYVYRHTSDHGLLCTPDLVYCFFELVSYSFQRESFRYMNSGRNSGLSILIQIFPPSCPDCPWCNYKREILYKALWNSKRSDSNLLLQRFAALAHQLQPPSLHQPLLQENFDDEQ